MKITGTNAVVNRLTKLSKRIEQAVGAAMYLEGWNIMNEAKSTAPLDEGTLMNSGYVTLPSSGSVELGFGGSASKYALIQHEDLSLDHSHTPGRGAKFLEKAAANADLARMRELFFEFLERGGKAGKMGPTEPR